MDLNNQAIAILRAAMCGPVNFKEQCDNIYSEEADALLALLHNSDLLEIDIKTHESFVRSTKTDAFLSSKLGARIKAKTVLFYLKDAKFVSKATDDELKAALNRKMPRDSRSK